MKVRTLQIFKIKNIRLKNSLGFKKNVEYSTQYKNIKRILNYIKN